MTEIGFLKYRKYSAFIAFIGFFVVLCASSILFKLEDNRQRDAFSLVKLIGEQKELNGMVIDSLVKTEVNDPVMKKILPVLVSDLQLLGNSNRRVTEKLNDYAKSQKPSFDNLLSQLNIVQANLESVIQENIKDLKKSKNISPYLKNRLLFSNFQYSGLLNKISLKLAENIEESNRYIRLTFLLILFITVCLLIFCFYMAYYLKVEKLRLITKTERLNSENQLLANSFEKEKITLENALNESLTKYKAVFDNMFDGFAYYQVLLDENDQTEDYILLEANDAFERLTGLSRENVVGKKISEIFPGIKESRYNWIGKYDKVALQGEIIEFEHNASNIERWYNISAYSPIKGYFVTLFEDITQRKKDENAIKHYLVELQSSKEKIERDALELAQLNKRLSESEVILKELNSNKDKFFSIIAHDLRTPFNALLGLSELLAKQINLLSTEEIKEYSTNIYISSNKLFCLLENLLKWAGLQSGRIIKKPSFFSLNNLINSVSELYRNNLLEKEITLELKLRPAANVFADKEMIETVLRNLFSNAIKFTGRQGRICVEMLSNRNYIEISFTDSGVGINENIINKLFKISEHITSSGTQDEKGTGLGLILCKDFVEMNGGTIWVCSTPGKGSKFTFTLPIPD
jgi:PAS domain S-box-containing protein